MSSPNNNKGNGGRRRKKKSKSLGGGTNNGGVDNSIWRRLNRDYREWLIERGIAKDAAAFNALSFEQRRSLSNDYSVQIATIAKTTELSELSNLTTLLRYSLIAQANPYAAISDSHYSPQDSEATKSASIAYYGLSSEKHCQVLGKQPEQIIIINAHIWPRSGTSMLPLFGLKTEDIHSPRNVLRLQKCIERAFDGRELAFVAGGGGGELVVKVLNTNLLPVFLKGTQLRFADIQGAPLRIPLPGVFPYRRLLAHHSVLSHRFAREKQWITEDLESQEVSAGALLEYSLDQQAQDRIKLLWQQK